MGNTYLGHKTDKGRRCIGSEEDDRSGFAKVRYAGLCAGCEVSKSYGTGIPISPCCIV